MLWYGGYIVVLCGGNNRCHTFSIQSSSKFRSIDNMLRVAKEKKSHFYTLMVVFCIADPGIEFSSYMKSNLI